MCVPGEPGQRSATLASTGQALAALRDALTFLATTDATALTVAEQADCLRGLQRAESVRIAAQTAVLDAFADGCGYADDGQGSARSWLRWQTRITGSAAYVAMAWTRRLAEHPRLREALAASTISESWARQFSDWTDLLPASARSDADAILLAAAAAGATLLDLAGLAEEMRNRTASPDRDSDDDGFGDRSLRLDLHYRGAGRLRGDLTPRCAASLQAILDALGKKKGPEDLRTQAQRSHDALEEACRRLIAAKCMPDRAGQATQIQLHMTLDQLLGREPGTTDGQPGTTSGQPGTTSGQPGTTSGQPGATSGQPGPTGGRPGTGEVVRRVLFPNIDDLTRPQPGGWTGPGALASPGDLCDASIVPIVSGHVDHELLDKLTGTLLGPAAAASASPSTAGDGTTDGGSAKAAQAARFGADYARELILRNAVALLSGPAGLACRLRTSRLRGPAASISLPLDVGAASDTIPAHLRRAVILRDVHCGFPGCTDPNCQVHHIIPLSEGGTTSLDKLILGCAFHHLIAIHTWGWKLILNADGTKTAISPDGKRILHSHDPPRVA
jgi:Domain of unknown function (DUF222)/HNH endonuclease